MRKWRKSSKSGGNAGSCVMVALDSSDVLIGDTKLGQHEGTPVLAVSHQDLISVAIRR